MNSPIYFDSDCLRTFIMIKQTNILIQLFAQNIFVPAFVCEELLNQRSVAESFQRHINEGLFKKTMLEPMSEDYRLFKNMVKNPDSSVTNIGEGEAECLVLAKKNNGVIASDNTSDTSTYIHTMHIRHLTTPIILVIAYEKYGYSEKTINGYWEQMKRYDRHQMLRYKNFSEYQAKNEVNLEIRELIKSLY